MNSLRIAATLFTLVLLTACARKLQPDQPAGLSGIINGTVAYRERIALPPDATIIVSLEDVTRTDQGSSFVAQQVLRSKRQVPIPFQLRYLPQAIHRDHRYIVRAEIVDVHDALLWSSTETYPVLFNQTEKPVAIIVQRPAVAVDVDAAPHSLAASGRTVPFKCDDFAFIAKFSAGQVELATPGRSITLPHVISGSGARYSDGHTTLWNKGNEAMLEMNGVHYKNCKTDTLPAVQ
jgi:putative lipoprotein